MKINIFWGEVTDISAKKEALFTTQCFQDQSMVWFECWKGIRFLQVDRIEAEIQRLVPGIRYVDLETDRGRFSGYKTIPLSFREPVVPPEAEPNGSRDPVASKPSFW